MKNIFKNFDYEKLKARMKTYKERPLSFIMMLLVVLSAAITIGILGFIIVYILVNGIPYLTPELFAWKYTSDNCSMMPAIINTLIITILALALAIWNIFSNISCGIC